MRAKIFLAAFLWVSVANAAPAYVQGVTHQNGSPSSGTVAATLSSPVGSGNAVFVSVGWAGTGSVLTNIKDDKVNTYNLVDFQTSGSSGYTFASGYLINITNGPTTVTATITGPVVFASIIVDEFSGVPAASVLDNHAIHDQPGASSVDVVTSTAVTILGNDLVYGSTVNATGGGTESVGAGFTQAQHTPSAFLSEYQIGVSAGSKAATFTPNAASSWISYMIALQIPAGGGPVVHSRLLQGVGR